MSAEEDLRRLIDEPANSSKYKSDKLAAILQAHNGDANLAAAQIWLEKAATYSKLVDMQEGDSKRNNSDLMKNATQMAKIFQGASNTGDTGVRPTGTNRIIRP
jgi:hypothetical protein